MQRKREPGCYLWPIPFLRQSHPRGQSTPPGGTLIVSPPAATFLFSVRGASSVSSAWTPAYPTESTQLPANGNRFAIHLYMERSLLASHSAGQGTGLTRRSLQPGGNDVITYLSIHIHELYSSCFMPRRVTPGPRCNRHPQGNITIPGTRLAGWCPPWDQPDLHRSLMPAAIGQLASQQPFSLPGVGLERSAVFSRRWR